MTQKYLDFHAHTIYSDGVSTPEILVKTARLSGLDMLAITDHDKLDAISEAIKAGKIWDIKIIPGIEVSTTKYHILGINVDYTSPKFREFVKESGLEQERVCKTRIEAIQSNGVPMTFEKLKKYFPLARLGKFNLCMAMIQDRECQDYFRENGIRLGNDNYKNYIKAKDGNEIADKFTTITPQRAINEIHQAGGLAFIAHPFKDVKKMQELDVLVSQGLDGLEIQPNFNGKNEPFEKYASEHNLLVTYGSDYHGGLFGREILGKGRNTLYPALKKALKLD